MIAIRSIRRRRRTSVVCCFHCSFLSTPTTKPSLSSSFFLSSSSSLSSLSGIGSFDDDHGNDNKKRTFSSSSQQEVLVIVRGTIPKFGYGVKVGQYAEIKRIYTKEDIEQYGTLIQDKNILHSPMVWSKDLLEEHPFLQSNYDAGLIQLQQDIGNNSNNDNERDDENDDGAPTITTTKPLVHGMMVSSLFSSIFANLVPGCVYLNQSLQFVKPIFAGDIVLGRITIEKIRRYPIRRRNRHGSDGDGADSNGIVVQCDTKVYKLLDRIDTNNNIYDEDDESSIVSIKGNASVWLPSGYADEEE